jgi:hypothetical protein
LLSPILQKTITLKAVEAIGKALQKMYPDAVERKNKVTPGICVSQDGVIHFVNPSDCQLNNGTKKYSPMNVSMRRFMFFFFTFFFE